MKARPGFFRNTGYDLCHRAAQRFGEVAVSAHVDEKGIFRVWVVWPHEECDDPNVWSFVAAGRINDFNEALDKIAELRREALGFPDPPACLKDYFGGSST